MAAVSEQCTVCGRVILQACDKYRLIKAPKKPTDAREQTKVGEALLKVTKSPDVLQLIKEDKLISNCCCIHCYKFIFKVKKAEQQLYLLRSELESKIKNTCIESSYRQAEYTAQRVLPPVQKQPILERPSGGPKKRVMQSPTSKSGITPPSKRSLLPVTSVWRHPLQPLSPSRLQQSPLSKTGITPPSKRPAPPPMRPVLQPLTQSTNTSQKPSSSRINITPPSKHPSPRIKRTLPPLAPKEIPVPSHTAATSLRRELFPRQSQSSIANAAQVFQEEIKIPVYTDLESDPDEDIKVSFYTST